MKKNNLGITLIGLVVTIVVLLILAGVSIALLTGDNGIMTQAKKAKITNELSEYKEQVELYKTAKKAENQLFEVGSLTVGKDMLEYNTKPAEEKGNIKTIITNISEEYLEKLEIIKGELLINTKNIEEIRIAQGLGIQVNPYDITEDGELLSSDGNLLLMDSNGTVTIPNSVTKIGEGAFANLEGLKTIIIPGTCKEIGTNAFRNNTTLEKVVMQDGVEIIGIKAFTDCQNLLDVQMPDSITYIKTQAFGNDTKLSSIILSQGLKKIDGYAFCFTGLTEIRFFDNLITINAAAFASCNNLETIYISKSIENIDGTAFNNCPKIKDINIDENNKNFVFKDNILLGNQGTEMLIILENAIKNNILTIPEGVTTLKNGQISQFPNIIQVIVPSSVTSIYPLFFENNIQNVIISNGNPKYETYKNAIYEKENGIRKSLIKYYGNEEIVTIEEGIIKLGEYSFRASNISEIKLPSSLETIESQVFSGNTKLTSIKLGENIKNINPLFIYSSKITEVSIDEKNENYTVYNDVLYNKDRTKLIAIIEPISQTVKFEIPKGVKEIGMYAFHARSNLESVIIPDTVTKLEKSFQYCRKLAKIEIPSSVTEIDTACFSECTNLTEIIVHKKKGEISGSPWGCIYGERAIKWDE